MAYRIAPVVNPRTLTRDETMMSFHSMRLNQGNQTHAGKWPYFRNEWSDLHNEWICRPLANVHNPFIPAERR
jgi:hypothetical protein